jgi:hypothetical protein
LSASLKESLPKGVTFQITPPVSNDDQLSQMNLEELADEDDIVTDSEDG